MFFSGAGLVLLPALLVHYLIQVQVRKLWAEAETLTRKSQGRISSLEMPYLPKLYLRLRKNLYIINFGLRSAS
jgi:hypothetical protein